MPRRANSGTRALPPPLPPERRTVGQLVAESIRLFGGNFVRALPIGLVVAGINQATLGLGRIPTGIVLLLAGPVFTLAYAYATQLVSGVHASAGAWVVSLVAGTLVWAPAALLFPWFALAAVLWLGLVGLAVPAAMVERTSVTDSLRRGLALGRVDYLHAAGSLATVVILFVLVRLGLALLLESQADNTVRTALFLADTVLAPMLFLGGAVLYGDQEARLRSREERREERDADVPDAHHADREGSPDPPREPSPSA
jgi:hypothetical protein